MKVLIAGVGNIFMGDDAFGCEVAASLARRQVPDGVHVHDFGTRGLDLTYALMDGFDAAVLIDAMPKGGAPGTLYVIDPETPEADGPAEVPLMAAHDLDPFMVLRACAKMGARCRRVLVLGCEPGRADLDAPLPTMCDAVRAAIEPAAAMALSLVQRLSAAGGTPELSKGGAHGIQPCV